MVPIYIIILFVQLFDCTIGYVNLAIHKPAWQTSNYGNNIASNAVDGNTNQKIGGNSCAVSSGKTASATWRLDLERILSIHHITIYYRNEVSTWRMAGFFLYASNTTTKDDGHLCFHELQTSPPPYIMSINCTQHARYVIYYNERKHDVSYPTSFSTDLFNELCEVEVYGCDYPGFYGQNCSTPCPINCKNKYCDIVNGTCLSCIDGYQGLSCEQVCSNSFYGENCGSNCGYCLDDVTCNNINGTCVNGCAAGWKSLECDTECPYGTYGLECKQSCNKNCKNDNCNHVDGKCTYGCKAGYDGDLCDMVCSDYFYGENCEGNCGYCLGGVTCNRINGTCVNGCAAGWKGIQCDTECPDGTYGLECKQSCNKNCKNTDCNHVDGICTLGCNDGYDGGFCDMVCSNSFYGENCMSNCGHCLDGVTCNHINGTCVNGCAAGWKGLRCDTECPDGTYGLECKQSCNKNCKNTDCNHVDGICSLGCNAGYYGDFCDMVCSNSFYGENCGSNCGHCLDGVTCNHIDGTCNNGCAEGWRGLQCDTECPYGTYGLECTQNCNINCKNTNCHYVDGKCTHGCKAGYDGDLCDKECNKRMYGQDCSLPCGNCLKSGQCDHITGNCSSGCDKGYFGETCKNGCLKTFYGENCRLNCSSDCVNRTCDAVTGDCIEIIPSVNPSDLTGAAVGGAVGGLVFVLLLASSFILFRRYKGKKAKENETILDRKVYSKESKEFHNLYENFHTKNKTETENKSEIEVDMETEVENADAIYENNTVREEKYSDIPVSQLEQVIIEKRQNDEERFKQEYTSFPLGEMCPCSIGKMEHNVKKNRFKTTFPYDHSRVVLNSDGDQTADYINANYIDGTENEKRRYIGSQGPKEGTVEDFWRMLWQENVTQVVMLTNLKEGIKEKCVRYWPDSPHRPFVVGRFTILKTVEKEYAFFVVRLLTVKHTQLKKQRTVTQFHYTAWPDHGVPDTLCLVEFHSYVMRSESKKVNSPIVVHCSAGIGRTGTYIALDALYKYGVKYGKVNIAEYVKTMRKNRMNMVQTREQYITIYLTLCEAFKASVNAIPVAKFVSHFEKVMEDAPTNQNPLRKEMLMLSRIKRKYSDLDFKLAKQNVDLKDNTGAILPLDKFTLHLMTSVPNRGSYINAILVPSFTKLNYFIVTPYPTQDTAVDLLRLVADQQSTNIVVMDPVRDIDFSTLWLPRRSSTATLEPFSITCKSVSNQDDTDTSIIQMSNTQIKGKPMEVSILAPRSRISVDKGSDTSVLRELVSAVLNSDANEPVIVMSRDAASQCGLFCAVFNVIQQMRLDEEIDIVTAVRKLQVRRPEFCSSLEEYRACYQTIADHILYSSDHIYSN